jgi:Family of unknown function (DUF6493)
MPLDPEKLNAIIETGDIAACLDYFRGAGEAERKKVAKVATSHLRSLKTRTSTLARSLSFLAETQVPPSLSVLTHSHGISGSAFQVVQVAVLASAPMSRWKSLRLEGMPPDVVDKILRDRRPPWLGEIIDLLLGLRAPFNYSYWPIARRMIRDGLCPAPTSTTYLEGMLAALISESWERKKDLKALLLEDPGLLEDEIWRIFECEPRPGSIQLLSSYDQGEHGRYSWAQALVELAREGKVPRARLLAATLAGLERDFHDQRARWFVALHEKLEPTAPERADLASRYAALLGSRNPSTVSFALKNLKQFEKAGQLDPDTLIANIAPALQARTKGTVKLALKLLDSAAARLDKPRSGAQAALVAAEALVHESAEIQGKALDLIERHRDPADGALVELLVDRAHALAPSQRVRLEKLLGSTRGPSSASADPSTDIDALGIRAAALDPRLSQLAGVPAALDALRSGGDLTALDFDGTEIPRLDPARVLKPVTDLDDLIDLCAGVIEGQASPEEFERVLDGVSRLWNGT